MLQADVHTECKSSRAAHEKHTPSTHTISRERLDLLGRKVPAEQKYMLLELQVWGKTVQCFYVVTLCTLLLLCPKEETIMYL